MSDEENLPIISKRNLSSLSHRDMVLFALFCARQLESEWKDIKECREAIDTVERWLEGKASSLECRYAAHTILIGGVHKPATYHAVCSMLNAVSCAYNTHYADYAAHHAAAIIGNKAIKAQWDYYFELLYFDDIAEKALLGEVCE